MSETQQTETQQPANDTLTPECFVALADFQAPADRLKAASRRQPGMTLTETMIVDVIMALVATGVGIAVVPQLQKAKIKQADSGVETVRSAVQLYIATNNAECATMEQLIEDKAIDKAKATTDPWDRAYRIECDGTDITVISAGPDGEFVTEDDIK